jgi:hypothetical protein
MGPVMEPFKIPCKYHNFLAGKTEQEMVEWSLTTVPERVYWIAWTGAKIVATILLVYVAVCLVCLL